MTLRIIIRDSDCEYFVPKLILICSIAKERDSPEMIPKVCVQNLLSQVEDMIRGKLQSVL